MRVTSRRLVSFRARSVAAICYEVEALGAPMRVAVQSNLLANETDNVERRDPRTGADLGNALESRSRSTTACGWCSPTPRVRAVSRWRPAWSIDRNGG